MPINPGLFITGLASGGGSGAILWRWNETDTSQFGADVFTPTTGTSTLSFVAGTDNYPALLRLSLTNFTGNSQFPITDELDFPSRYLLYYKFHNRTGAGGGTNDVAGWWVLSNALSGASGFSLFYGHRPGSTTALVIRDQAGVFSVSAATMTQASYAAAYPSVAQRLMVDCEPFPIAGATPNFCLTNQNFAVGDAASDGCTRAQGVFFGGSYAGWTGQTLNRLGFGAHYETGSLTHTIDVTEMIVFAHPADW